jgi:hypothetical protein
MFGQAGRVGRSGLRLTRLRRVRRQWLVVQQRLLHGPQLGAGSDAQLLHQTGTCGGAAGKCFPFPPVRGKRPYQYRCQRFVEGMLFGQVANHRQDSAGLAET